MSQNFPNLDDKQLDALERKINSMGPDHEVSLDQRPNIQGAKVANDTVVQPSSIFPENQIENIKESIKTLNQELVSPSRPRTADKENELTYRDTIGNETFYVKNISGRHVCISEPSPRSDMPGLDIFIKVGEVADLLQMADIDRLKRSRDLRRALMGVNGVVELKRLTQEEFDEEERKANENRRKLEILRQQETLRTLQQTQVQNQNLMPHERPLSSPLGSERAVRPMIKAKLGKLALRYDKDPQISRQAMTSLEFIQWINSEPLTHWEIDNIMGDPAVVRDHDIRAALLEKKQNTPPEG